MARIERTRLAREDYANIWHDIADDNEAAADRLLRAIDAKLLLYAEHPGMGTQRSSLAAGVRSFPVGRYLVFYREIEGGIELLRVLHGSRRLRSELRREL